MQDARQDTYFAHSGKSEDGSDWQTLPEHLEGTAARAATAGERLGLPLCAGLAARFHDFGNGGVTGVLLLAESHVSVHTWPEKSFAALDIFLCGTAQVEPARAVLEAAFAPERVTATLIRRGA